MSGPYETHPFEPGQTLRDAITATGASSTDGLGWEGYEKDFLDYDWSVRNTKPLRSNAIVRRRIVRNTSSNYLVPGNLVFLLAHGGWHTGEFITAAISTPSAAGTFPAAAGGGVLRGRVGGYARHDLMKAYPVDEFLTHTVAPNDLFWITVKGPALCRTAMAQMAADIYVSDVLHCLTAASTFAATSISNTAATTYDGGKLQRLNASTTFEVDRHIALLGLALSACTSQGYNQPLLVDIGGHLV